MTCKRCKTAMYWASDEDAWVCYKCGERAYAVLATSGYPDCDMQFSVNCGSIVGERTHGRNTLDTWVRISRATSLWHAHQEKIENRISYYTHTDSFDYGYEQYKNLKQQHYMGSGWEQNLWNQNVQFTDTSSGSTIISKNLLK